MFPFSPGQHSSKAFYEYAVFARRLSRDVPDSALHRFGYGKGDLSPARLFFYQTVSDGTVAACRTYMVN